MGSCITKETAYEPEPLIVKNQEQIYGFTGYQKPRRPTYRYTADIETLPSYLTLESELDALERRLSRKRQLSIQLEAEYGTIGTLERSRQLITLDQVKQKRRRRRAELHHQKHFITYSDH